MSSSDLLDAPPSIKVYQRYRDDIMSLNENIIQAYVNADVIYRASRALKLRHNQILSLGGWERIDALKDYALYEVKTKGQNLVQRYYQEKRGKGNDLKKALLGVMAQAETGLFRIEEARKDEGQLTVQELTGERRQLIMMDVSLSHSGRRGIVMFSRMFDFGRFITTTGAAFLFKPEEGAALVWRWNQWPATRRYVGYYQWSKRSGFKVLYV